jgi:hypothetical protein
MKRERSPISWARTPLEPGNSTGHPEIDTDTGAFPPGTAPGHNSRYETTFPWEHDIMSARRIPRHAPDQPEPVEGENWVRVPTVVDTSGDKVVTLYDEQGRPHTRLVAEVVLETFGGPRPPGHVVRFKDGNRLNCELSNLEWVESPGARDEAARARAITTRERADAIRRSLEGRRHSDSAELVAEARQR